MIMFFFVIKRNHSTVCTFLLLGKKEGQSTILYLGLGLGLATALIE